ncbi:MAG: helix-turn-helix domain-containing protein [Spirochaetaceae bacterium]|jgi:transcriptional regulator with XRE-family HTH domain|nr:helix-turn-helix domain-containing protein [Spirochaetaceae bacterium]
MPPISGDDIRSLLSKNLKQFRARKGLSQLKLANIAELTHNFINEIENGQKWISPETLAKLAEVLEVKPYQFFLPAGSGTDEESEIFTGYLDDLSDSFNKMVHDIRSRYSQDTEEPGEF